MNLKPIIRYRVICSGNKTLKLVLTKITILKRIGKNRYLHLSVPHTKEFQNPLIFNNNRLLEHIAVQTGKQVCMAITLVITQAAAKKKQNVTRFTCSHSDKIYLKPI